MSKNSFKFAVFGMMFLSIIHMVFSLLNNTNSYDIISIIFIGISSMHLVAYLENKEDKLNLIVSVLALITSIACVYLSLF